MIAFLLSLLPLYLQGYDYLICDLGTLMADESYVTGINNQNTIVGYVKEGNKTSSFIWEPNNGPTLLPYPKYQSPLINNHNQVVDIFWHKTNYWFSDNVYSKHIYIYDNGLAQDITLPKEWKIQELEEWRTLSVWDGGELGILSFNDNQQILITNAKEFEKATRFAIWQNGRLKEIDTSLISNVYAMNNHGLILGRRWIKKENINTPMLVLYNPTEETLTEIIKDVNIINRKLNDRGEVIIFQILQNPQLSRGFLWSQTKQIIELEDFAPVAFNNCGQIVGFKIPKIEDEELLPAIWNQGKTTPLTQIIGLGGIESTWSRLKLFKAINDNGYIIGEGLFDGKQHGFVLIPQ